MKSKILFLLVLGSVILGLALFGYLGAIPDRENQTGKRAQIELTPDSFDFGEVKYGQVLEHSFKVKNTGDEVLEIKRVATSCACTVAKIKNQISKIKRGEEVYLIVTYNTGLMSGPHAKGSQERIIYVKSNDPENPQAEVRIKAVVN